MAVNSSLLYQTTGHGTNKNAKSHQLHFCPGLSNALFESVDSSVPYFVNAALNAPLAIATTFANMLVLLAMRHVTSIRFRSKLLLYSLVLTDLGAGLVVQPQFAAFFPGKAIHPGLVQCVPTKSYYFTASVFSSASFCMLVAISLDRYAALFFYVRYQQIVTTRRVCIILTFMWSISMFVALPLFWDYELWLAVGPTIGGVNFLVISVAYIRIYRRLRAQRVQPQETDQVQQQAGNTLNMERYRRIATAMMWVYVLFLIFYVPLMCSDFVGTIIGRTALIVCIEEYGYTLVLLNSFLNPFVYCLRMPDIRIEVVKQLRNLCCRSFQR